MAAEPKSPKGRAVARSNIARAVMQGNGNALKAGVYSTVAIREDVRDEAAIIFARAQWLDETRDGPLVESTARIAVRLRRLDDLLASDPGSFTQTLTSMYVRLEGQLVRNLDALGLTPRAAADLGVTKLDAAERARRLSLKGLEAYREPSDD